MRLTTATLAVTLIITIAGCSIDRSALPTKPGASLEAINLAPIEPLSHDGPVAFDPDRALPTFTIRASKGTKFPKDVGGSLITSVTLAFSPARGSSSPPYRGGVHLPYRHLKLGTGALYYTGSGCCASPVAVRIKPHEVQVWFAGAGDPGSTLKVSVGSQTFDVPIPETWPKATIGDLHECVYIPRDYNGLLPCGVEPE